LSWLSGRIVWAAASDDGLRVGRKERQWQRDGDHINVEISPNVAVRAWARKTKKFLSNLLRYRPARICELARNQGSLATDFVAPFNSTLRAFEQGKVADVGCPAFSTNSAGLRGRCAARFYQIEKKANRARSRGGKRHEDYQNWRASQSNRGLESTRLGDQQ